MTDEKKVITQEDLDANPELVEQGLSVGDDFPAENAAPDEASAATADGEPEADAE